MPWLQPSISSSNLVVMFKSLYNIDSLSWSDLCLSHQLHLLLIPLYTKLLAVLQMYHILGTCFPLSFTLMRLHGFFFLEPSSWLFISPCFIPYQDIHPLLCILTVHWLQQIIFKVCSCFWRCCFAFTALFNFLNTEILFYIFVSSEQSIVPHV